MTREELVKQKAQEFASRGEYSPSLTESFVAGAEWEHKRLVEKACEWLKENVSKYSYVIKVEDTEYRKVHFTDSLIEDFRKAMKEK